MRILIIFLHLLLAIPCFANYQAKNFNHLLNKVEGIDPKLLSMHFALYKGYVNNINTLLALIEKEENKTIYGALKRRVGFEFDGMLLHEYYFENLGGRTPLSTKSPLYQKIIQDFGSYEAWRQDFKNTGMIRGIGWVILYLDPKDKKLHNIWINEHQVNHLSGATPLLVMDVWEHAYITQFGLDRSKYIDIFFNNILWAEVEARLK